MYRKIKYDLSTESIPLQDLKRLGAATGYKLRDWGSGLQGLEDPDWYNENSPEQLKLLKACEKVGIKLPIFWMEEVWTPEELKEAEFLFVCPDPASGWFDLKKMGNTFDDKKYCSECSYTKVVSSPLRIDKKLAGKRDIMKFGQELVVSERMRERLMEEKITGLKFVEAKDSKHRDSAFAKFFHVKAPAAPPLADSPVRKCPKCGVGRLRYWSDLKFKKADAKKLKDLNVPAEHVNGQVFWIVSKRLYNLLIGIKARSFKPLAVIRVV